MRIILLFFISIMNLTGLCFAQYSSLGDSGSSPTEGGDSAQSMAPSTGTADSAGSGYSSREQGDPGENSGYYATGPGDADGIGFSSPEGQSSVGYTATPAEIQPSSFDSTDGNPDEGNNENSGDNDPGAPNGEPTNN